MNEKMDETPEDFIEIKGLNIFPGLTQLPGDSVCSSGFILIGNELKYLPSVLKNSIQIHRQEAFELAIDIIGNNPLLLLEWFKRKYKIKGGIENGKKNKEVCKEEKGETN